MTLELGTHVKPDDDGIGYRRQGHVRLGDGTGRRVNHIDIDLFVGQLGQRVLERFDTAVDIGFDDQVQVFDFPVLHFLEKTFKAHAAVFGQFQ